MKKGKRLMSVLTCAAVLAVMSAVPVSATEEKDSIRIIVENNTYSSENGSAWDGTLIDKWVEIDENSTAASIISGALTGEGYADPVADGMYGSYIDSVNGLSSGAGSDLEGSMYPGWMFAVNDWYGNNGLDAFSAADGTLADGDEIRLSYSLNMGADLGSDFYNTDTTLSSLDISAQLEPEFSSDIKEYEVTPDEGQTELFVYPETANKNFCCRIYRNEYEPESLSFLRSSKPIEFEQGDTIYIGIANSNWQYLSEGVEETVYKLHIKGQDKTDDENGSDQNTGEQPTDNGGVSINTDKMIESITARITANDSFAVFGNEWQVMTLARLEKLSESSREKYLSSVEEYLKENEFTKATDNARIIIALTALGADASDFAGKNITEQLADFNYVSKQGINGVIFSLIALDTKNYTIPENNNKDTQTTRNGLVDYILSAQLSDGGWTFFGDTAEPDLTGMAIEALAPYYKNNEKVSTAVDNAVRYLSSVQNKDGTYTSYGAANCECSAQTVTALSALSIDADRDTWFAKTEGTALTGLKRFYIPDSKGFSHIIGEEYNSYADAQAFYALAAYSRMISGKTSLYDMSDVEFRKQSKPEPQNEQSKEEVIKDNNNNNNNKNTSAEIKSDNNTNSTVPTGEQSKAWILAVILAVSAVLIIVLIFTGKKSKKK